MNRGKVLPGVTHHLPDIDPPGTAVVAGPAEQAAAEKLLKDRAMAVETKHIEQVQAAAGGVHLPAALPVHRADREAGPALGALGGRTLWLVVFQQPGEP